MPFVLSPLPAALPRQALWPEVTVGPAIRCVYVTIRAPDPAVSGRGLHFRRLVIELWRQCI